MLLCFALLFLLLWLYSNTDFVDVVVVWYWCCCIRCKALPLLLDVNSKRKKNITQQTKNSVCVRRRRCALKFLMQHTQFSSIINFCVDGRHNVNCNFIYVFFCESVLYFCCICWVFEFFVLLIFEEWNLIKKNHIGENRKTANKFPGKCFKHQKSKSGWFKWQKNEYLLH